MFSTSASQVFLVVMLKVSPKYGAKGKIILCERPDTPQTDQQSITRVTHVDKHNEANCSCKALENIESSWWKTQSVSLKQNLSNVWKPLSYHLQGFIRLFKDECAKLISSVNLIIKCVLLEVNESFIVFSELWCHCNKGLEDDALESKFQGNLCWRDTQIHTLCGDHSLSVWFWVFFYFYYQMTKKRSNSPNSRIIGQSAMALGMECERINGPQPDNNFREGNIINHL